MSELRLKSTGTIKLFENDNTSNVTIASPASLGADRTITLPDASVTLASGTMLATDGDGSSLTGLTPGITVADQWRVTVGWTGNVNPIASNWEQVDSPGQGTVGSAMTESSGIFTFPSTGIYKIDFTIGGAYGTADVRYVHNFISFSDASAAMQPMAYSNQHVYHQGAATYVTLHCCSLVDVTSTSTKKVSFSVFSDNASATTFLNDSTHNYTYATFIRIGDT